MTPAKRHELFARLAAANPNPRSELVYSDPFELLVAVVLSAQATDVSVNKATEKLYKVANTPAQILALGEDGLKTYIKTIGLYNAKARNVIALCRQLIDEYNDEVPSGRDALQKLPGVGWKTASVVANVAFGQPTLAVDTHIFRIANRTGLAPGKSADAISKKLEKIVPREFIHDAHHWLILHGRYVCKARTPECWRCSIKDLCSYRAKTPAIEAKPENLRGKPLATTRQSSGRSRKA